MLVDDAFMVVVVVLSLESRRLFATTFRDDALLFYAAHDFVPRAGSKLSLLFFFLLLRLGFRVYFFFFKKSFYEGGVAP